MVTDMERRTPADSLRSVATVGAFTASNSTRIQAEDLVSHFPINAVKLSLTHLNLTLLERSSNHFVLHFFDIKHTLGPVF